ncbi:hypothetical protein PHMEG_0006463 [Phytophthora megakarya]|uniref:PiggyBac transposable element-derived protein domain-containing protein n=1 Tax=Phytophthora megakarya TaxID=4795 RepID=A0A225WP51_9STRA|nr:hypothetical protein PHMEG_0006463 [Phytophthora megakarya]
MSRLEVDALMAPFKKYRVDKSDLSTCYVCSLPAPHSMRVRRLRCNCKACDDICGGDPYSWRTRVLTCQVQGLVLSTRAPDIEPWEVLRVMIACMLQPIRKGVEAHWSTKEVGALPTNRFNLFMPRNQFITSWATFTSQTTGRQGQVLIVWKIRSVVDVLHFDEVTLPSRSRYILTRQVNKDKPHKIEVYCCAKTHLQTPVPRDNNTKR